MVQNLSFRFFSVIASGFKLPHPLSCGLSQGSVLGPTFLNKYTTPLISTLISSWSLNHHIYADDTQIFISFVPKTFITSISQLQDTISDIPS